MLMSKDEMEELWEHYHKLYLKHWDNYQDSGEKKYENLYMRYEALEDIIRQAIDADDNAEALRARDSELINLAGMAAKCKHHGYEFRDVDRLISEILWYAKMSLSWVNPYS